MQRYLIRLVLIACAFYFVFPMIPGIKFHGSFIHAVGVGVLFAFIGWIIESFAIAISTLMTIGTLGLALLILIPAWIFGFWLLPALALRWLADCMPASLSFTGWEPAIWGGLVMLVIGIVTGGETTKRIRSDSRNGNTSANQE